MELLSRRSATTLLLQWATRINTGGGGLGLVLERSWAFQTGIAEGQTLTLSTAWRNDVSVDAAESRWRKRRCRRALPASSRVRMLKAQSPVHVAFDLGAGGQGRDRLYATYDGDGRHRVRSRSGRQAASGRSRSRRRRTFR